MNIQGASDSKNSSHQRNNQGSSGGVGGASKSIFNASYKELKPSKSVDLSSFNQNNGGAAGAQHYDENLFNQLSQTLNLADSPTNAFLLREKEKIVQIACGSIHTLARSNMNRIFSCGNGSTYALGHKSRDSCSTFKQIEFFNGADEGVAGIGIKTIACGLSHSGCVLADGAVYLWGITGDIQHSKDFMEKCLMKIPTRISFRGSDSSNGNVSHRRRSNA